MERKIKRSKTLRIDDRELTIDDVNRLENLGYVVLHMEKLNDCLVFHMVQYED